MDVFTPYKSRNWLPLREQGCHRTILVEEMINAATNSAVNVELYELDQLSPNGLHHRTYPMNLFRGFGGHLPTIDKMSPKRRDWWAGE
jgi:hypothetical protein